MPCSSSRHPQPPSGARRPGPGLATVLCCRRPPDPRRSSSFRTCRPWRSSTPSSSAEARGGAGTHPHPRHPLPRGAAPASPPPATAGSVASTAPMAPAPRRPPARRSGSNSLRVQLDPCGGGLVPLSGAAGRGAEPAREPGQGVHIVGTPTPRAAPTTTRRSRSGGHSRSASIWSMSGGSTEQAWVEGGQEPASGRHRSLRRDQPPGRVPCGRVGERPVDEPCATRGRAGRCRAGGAAGRPPLSLWQVRADLYKSLEEHSRAALARQNALDADGIEDFIEQQVTTEQTEYIAQFFFVLRTAGCAEPGPLGGYIDRHNAMIDRSSPISRPATDIPAGRRRHKQRLWRLRSARSTSA